MGALTGLGPVAADDARPRSGAALESTQASGSLKASVGTEAGYDSNLDNQLAAHGSRYEMIRASVSGTLKTSESSTLAMYLGGRNYWYDSLADAHRYDIDLSLNSRMDLSPGMALKTGAAFYRDKISFNSADIYKAYADLVKEGDFARLRIKLESRTEISTVDDEQGLLDPDVFEVARGRAFDYTKNGVTGSLLMFRKQLIAPFVIANYTNVEYIHQASNPAIDRSANEVWAVAGLRVTLGHGFHIDLGARHNHRDFADKLFTEFSSSHFDGRFKWRPLDGLTIRGVIERQIKEPTTSFGLADDVTTYELGFDQRVARWTLYGRAYLDHIRPIGDKFDYYKYNWQGGVAYDLGRGAEAYGEYLGRYVAEKITGESYDRGRLGAGIRVHF
jgi:hypothetical protein